MTTQHTPTPWTLRYGCIIEMDGTEGTEYTSVSGRKRNANAEFILRACNSHERLLNALNVMVLTTEIVAFLEIWDPKALEQARAAIAAAKEDA